MDMGGWDVVYASGVKSINAVLANSMEKLLATFAYSDANTGVSISGTFGPWSIRPGGTANRINVQVPITQGTLTGGGLTNISLNGVQPVLNVALKLAEGGNLPNSQDVAFDIQGVAANPASAKNGEIYLATSDESGELKKRDPSGVAGQILNDCLPRCFVANKEKISYVFASVFTSPHDQPWLAPKVTDVTYFGSQDGAEQVIAIKTLTQASWSSDGLPQAVDPALLNGSSSQLFYSLSKAVFLKNLVLPALPQALGNGVTVDHFKFNPPTDPAHQDTCSITNTQQFGLAPVDHAGINYYPVITGFNVVINNNQIVTTASGKFDITGLAGAWVAFDNLQVVNELYYNQQTQRAEFRLVSQMQPSVEKNIPWEYWLLCIFLVGLIIRGIIELVVTVVDNAVQSALTGTGNLELVSIPPSTAVWTGLSQFKINEADLEQAFVLRA